MIEGLSKMVFKARKEGILSGINFLADVKTTHFLFVDDVTFFGLDKLKNWEALHAILEIFCNATCMEANADKSCIYTHKVQTKTVSELKKLFQFKFEQMEDGFRYLGFN